MASPQTEHGFTRLANELFEAVIRHPFTKRQYKVLLAVIRKTYGFQKQEDDLTAPQLAAMTELDRANVIRAINELVEMNVLTKRAGQYGQVLGINKDYEAWAVPKRHPPASAKTTLPTVPEQHREACQNGTGAGANSAPSIDNTQQTLPKTQPPPRQAAEGNACAPGSGGDDLVFPEEMTDAELNEARALVRQAGPDAQAVLDVLAATIKAGEIRKSRLAVLSGLIRRYQAGSFDPTPGLHLAERRQRDAAAEAARQRRERELTERLNRQAGIEPGEGREAFLAAVAKLRRSTWR